MKKLVTLLLSMCMLLCVALGAAAEQGATYPWPVPEGDEVGTMTTHAVSNEEIFALFENRTYAANDPLVESLNYYIYDPVAHGADPNGKYPMIFFFHGSQMNLYEGAVIPGTDMGVYATKEYQDMLGGHAYVVLPRANEVMGENRMPIGSWNDVNPETGRSMYLPALKGLLDELVATGSVDENKIAVGGCSAGGHMAWQFTIAYPEVCAASFPLSPIYVPTEEELDMLEDKGVPVWVLHGIYDELATYDQLTGTIIDSLNAHENVRATILEYVRFGDKKIASLNRGIEMGQHASQYAIGENMLYDDGTPYDERYPDGFCAWLNEAFAADEKAMTPEEKYNQAMAYQMQGDMANGFPLLMQAAEEGYAQAQYIMGEFNQSGDYAEPNYEEALKWNNLAVAQNHARAKVNLGILYMRGLAVEVDYARAMELFLSADAQEDVKAPRYVGYMNENGLGCETNAAEAAKWYQIGVERGDVTSYYYLGRLYECGEGVTQDYTKAMELYLASSGRNDHVSASSQLAVGKLYLNGLGVEQDLVEAEKWIARAARNGSEEAAQLLQEISSDVEVKVESTLYGSAFTNGMSTLKKEYGVDVTYSDDGAAVITLALPDGSAIDDSKIDSSKAKVYIAEGDAYLPEEFVLAATQLDGVWENGMIRYTLEEGDITWFTDDYEIDNGGREWSCLGGDGKGLYVLNLCVDGITYDGKLVDSQSFQVKIQIYGCDYTGQAAPVTVIEPAFAALGEKAEVPVVEDQPVWTWIGKGEKPILCDDLADDFYISWPEAQDASALTAENIEIVMYSAYGDEYVMEAGKDYYVKSEKNETQIAVTMLYLPLAPVYTTMTISAPAMETEMTYDIASVYINVVQSGGGMDRDGTVVCYTFVGFENLTDYQQVLPPMTYKLVADVDGEQKYYAEDAEGKAYLTVDEKEAMSFDAAGPADQNVKMIGMTVFTTTRMNAQEEKIVDGQSLVLNKKYISGWPMYKGMIAKPGYVIGMGMEHHKWAWAENVAQGWTEDNLESEELPGVFVIPEMEGMNVLYTHMCGKTIYDPSFDVFFDGGVEAGMEALLNAGKVYVNGISVPAEPEYYELNGSAALWQLESGNWTWKSHDVMWGDETGEGVADFSEARKNFLNGLTQFRGMTVLLLAEEDSETTDAIVITIVNSGMVEAVTDNGDGTMTAVGLPVTAASENFDSTIAAGDIVTYWIGYDGMHVQRAIPENGVYHYEIGIHPWVEAFEVDSINGESYADAQIARIIPEGSRPNQFARALKRLDLQDVEMIGWWTDTHYLIGCTRTDESARLALETAVAHAEAGTAGIVVSVDGTDVGVDAYWVTQEIWDAYQAALTAAKDLLADENATSAQINEMLCRLADTYGSKMGMGDHLSGPAGVIGSMAQGSKQ